MSSNQNFKTGVTDISSATEDISIRKQHRNITLIDKDKKTKNEAHQLIILEKGDNVRKDIFGNEIKKGGKQKVSFIDNPILNNFENQNYVNLNKSENEKIVDLVNVESYKEYNKLMLFDIKKEIYPTDTICCESCYII